MNDIKSNSLIEKSKELIEELVIELQSIKQENQELKQEVKTWKIVSSSEDLIDMSEVAKTLNYKGYGRNKIFELLRDLEILRWNNQPYQRYVDNGFFKIIEQYTNDLYGNTKIYLKTVCTQKGLDFIRKQLDSVTD